MDWDGVPLDDVRASRRLLRLLLVACCTALALSAVALTWRVTDDLRDRALADERRDLVSFARLSLTPLVADGTGVGVDRLEASRLRRTLALDQDIRVVEIWRRDGRLAWSSRRNVPQSTTSVDPTLLEALATGRPAVSTIDANRFAVVVPIRRGRR